MIGPEDNDDAPPESIEIPIEDVLDLHAFAPRDVPELVRNYLDECAERRLEHVRIIHGKGTGSLQRTVHALLAKHPKVASFRTADESRGGWGATLVDLKCS